jgi:hypothetical protein
VGKGHNKAGNAACQWLSNHRPATIMADQAELVTLLHTLHQVLNYKGTEQGLQYRSRPACPHLGRDHPAGEVLRVRTLAS